MSGSNTAIYLLGVPMVSSSLLTASPEWENPEVNPHGPQATPIPVRRILLALKKSDEEIQAILDLEKTDAWLDRILA